MLSYFKLIANTLSRELKNADRVLFGDLCPCLWAKWLKQLAKTLHAPFIEPHGWRVRNVHSHHEAVRKLFVQRFHLWEKDSRALDQRCEFLLARPACPIACCYTIHASKITKQILETR